MLPDKAKLHKQNEVLLNKSLPEGWVVIPSGEAKLQKQIDALLKKCYEKVAELHKRYPNKEKLLLAVEENIMSAVLDYNQRTTIVGRKVAQALNCKNEQEQQKLLKEIFQFYGTVLHSVQYNLKKCEQTLQLVDI